MVIQDEAGKTLFTVPISADDFIAMLLKQTGSHLLGEQSLEKFKAGTKKKVEKSWEADMQLQKKERNYTYDRDGLLAKVKAGERAAAIAEEFNVPLYVVYDARKKMLREGSISKNDVRRVSKPINGDRILEMVRNGDSTQEIKNVMHDFMTEVEIEKAIAWAQHQAS